MGRLTGSHSEGDPELVEAVSEHLETHLGQVEHVLHEIVSPLVHVDLYVIGPSEERPFRTIVTCGMAEAPMLPPDGAEQLRRAELFLCLPLDWPLDEASLQDEQHWWPLRLLKSLARFPHDHETWLWEGHTLATSEPPAPYAPGTGLSAALVAPPIRTPDAFAVLEREGQDPIHFFAVIPLHADELAIARRDGAEALFGAFEQAAVDVVIDPRRPSAISPRRRRRRFGLF